MKVLTNHLLNLITKHFILRDNNYVGLSEGSIEIPIKLINMLLEDAKLYKKPIWILMQDLFKAYDCVDLSILRKAIIRIKIPLKCINFIVNFFTHRKNAILTTREFTKLFDVKISIDQEKIILSLL